MKKKILCIFGTRPEAVKMAPLVIALKKNARFQARVAVTAQHRGMLDQVLRLFGIRPDADLNIMREGQSLTDVTVRALARLAPVLARERPDMVLVHGDTTTTLAATLAAFYQKIPVGHVEAGLRTGDPYRPFPEEINRRLTDAAAAIHFAPTAEARRNLLREGVKRQSVFVTGNTGIDALFEARARLAKKPPALPPAAARALAGPCLLVTAHRRENFGEPLENIFRGLLNVARRRPGLSILYPVHPNPRVAGPARRRLGKQKNVFLTAPLDYGALVHAMAKSLLVVTDSGGIQEEAPSLGKPVLVLREVTERPEAVRAGTVRLVGSDPRRLEREINRLLDDRVIYRNMAEAVNPYGDGRAAARTLQALMFYFGYKRFPPPSFKPLS